MYIGHYSTAIAAKAIAPQMPFWLVLMAAQFIDVMWAIFILTGVERISLDPSLASNPFVLESIPYSHGLFPAVVWSGLVYLLARYALPYGAKVAALLAAVVFSHWLLDVPVHRPDLHIMGDLYIGLSLWDYPFFALALELGVIVLGGWWLSVKGGLSQNKKLGLVSFLVLLVVIQLSSHFGPLPESPEALAVSALVSYAAVAYLGYLMLDRKRSGSNEV